MLCNFHKTGVSFLRRSARDLAKSSCSRLRFTAKPTRCWRLLLLLTTSKHAHYHTCEPTLSRLWLSASEHGGGLSKIIVWLLLLLASPEHAHCDPRESSLGRGLLLLLLLATAQHSHSHV